jgi:DNA (cytosine-5)-methyltransferase 1
MTNRLTNSIEFGAPQDRDRILLFGISRERFPNLAMFNFPWKHHVVYDWKHIRNLHWPTTDTFAEGGERECPMDIPRELTVQYWFDKNDVTHHPNAGDCFVPRQGLRKMLVVEEGDVSKKSHKRLHRWRYSPTVAYGNNEVHLHPYHARRLTVAEALSLQSLPKEFVLPPDMSLTDKFKTTGNGVPFLMAKGIATTIREYLDEIAE